MATRFTQIGSCLLKRLLYPKAKAAEAIKCSQVLLTKSGPFSTSTKTADLEDGSAKTVKPFSAIPTPKGLPFIGTMLQVTRESSKTRDFLFDKCEKFYPIYRKAGVVNAVVLLDVENIEKLFRSDGKYPRRYDFVYWKHYRKVSGQPAGLLTSNGESWLKMRKVIDKPMLRIKDVSGYADDVNEVVTDFLERLGEIRQGDGQIPDLERELFNWSLETVGKILYERRFGGLSQSTRDAELQEFIDAIRALLTTTAETIIFPIWFSKIFLRKVYNKQMQSLDTLTKVAKKCVDQRIKELAYRKEQGGEKSTGVLSYLLQENSLSVEEVYSNAIDLMAGAVDTTSTTMLWMFQELALSPDVQDKLLAEVESVVPDGKLPTYQDLQKMPYLKAVIKETLRKYTAVPAISRILPEDTELCGYLVPAKTPVIIYPTIMGYLPQLFKDPEQFKPERWLRGTGDKINPFSVLSFGHGTRMCIGRRVAELEMHMLLSRLIRQFSIAPAFTERATPCMEIVLKPDRPIKIRLINRKSS